MTRTKPRYTDIAIFCALVGMIVFGHLTLGGGTAHASLLMQGAGLSYTQPVNERATDLEYNAREALASLGAAEYSYSTNRTAGQYAYLQDLVRSGYLQPNQTGKSLAASYSITFYLPSGHQGFTLVAEPLQNDLRPFMISDNRQVVLITPSVQGDPNQDWASVRETENEIYWSSGLYEYLNGFKLLSYDPPLQVRLNREGTSYVLVPFSKNREGMYIPDDSLVYIASFAGYMIGDTRQIE